MSWKFTAVDVTAGNAFLLEQGSASGRRAKSRRIRLLVDGGLRSSEVAAYLAAALWPGGRVGQGKRPIIETLALTHTDADHLGGLLAVLALPLQVKELWLPSRWSSDVVALITRPGEVMQWIRGRIWRLTPPELGHALRKVAPPAEGQGEQSELHAALAAAKSGETGDDEWQAVGRVLLDEILEGWAEQTSAPESERGHVTCQTLGTLCAGAPAHGTLELAAVRDSRVLFYTGGPSPRSWGHFPGIAALTARPEAWQAQVQFALLLAAVRRTAAIRSLVMAAHRVGARVRWFQYQAESNRRPRKATCMW